MCQIGNLLLSFAGANAPEPLLRVYIPYIHGDDFATATDDPSWYFGHRKLVSVSVSGCLQRLTDDSYQLEVAVVLYQLNTYRAQTSFRLGYLLPDCGYLNYSSLKF